jgi:pimeloyl-ACP methyl ester carboxylesterase
LEEASCGQSDPTSQENKLKSKAFRIISISILVLLILVLGTAITGVIARSSLAKRYPAPGQLVEMGGYTMHINCMGQGSPTVILEAGKGDFSLTWAYVQPEIAETTHVCSYDRAGYGWSEPSPYSRTASAEVEELHRLLVNANIQGPYVLVGHSLGGMLVRMYAHEYPDEVVGMVLVDSLHEELPLRLPEIIDKGNQIAIRQLRTLTVLSSTGIMTLAPQSIPNFGLPDDAYVQYQAIMATTGFFGTSGAETAAERDSVTGAHALQMTSFGDMPLIVLSRGRWEPFTFFSDAENQQYWDGWQATQSELVSLSSEGKQVIAEQSGHFIQLDQPDLVIDAIQEVVEAICQ